MVIWNILRPFGIFCGNLVCFPSFWFIVSRKIWQPWLLPACSKKKPAGNGITDPRWKKIFYNIGSQGIDALELAKQSEQSLNDLLGLKEEDDDEENILLEIDSQLDAKKKSGTGDWTSSPEACLIMYLHILRVFIYLNDNLITFYIFYREPT
jgi:hypothetical protein